MNARYTYSENAGVGGPSPSLATTFKNLADRVLPFGDGNFAAQGNEAKLVAETLAISRPRLYYRRQLRALRADRSHDQEIITARGERPAYGYRRVVWWLGRRPIFCGDRV